MKHRSFSDTVSADQLAILGFTGLLSPLIWLMPHAASESAGKAAVISPRFAVPILCYVLFFCNSFAKARQSGEGLADIIIRCLGKAAGKVICAAIMLWLIFYSGMMLRAGCERFLSTIFPDGNLWIFMPVTLLLAVIGAIGRVRSLAASSQMFFRLIIFVLGAIFLFTLPEISKYNLLPYTKSHILPAAQGGVALAFSLTPAIYVLFLAGKVSSGSAKRRVAWLSAAMILISFLTILTIIGNFGASFANTMQNPFFIMIRNIRIFNITERIEAVVVAMWVLTDFVFLASMLKSSGVIVCAILPKAKEKTAVLLCAAAVFFIGMYVGRDAFTFLRISRAVCPLGNAAVVLIILPAVWVIGKLRKKL